MSTVKFIVPATYEAQIGVEKDGVTPKMGQLPHDNAGQVVAVLDEDAHLFDEMGWKREGAAKSYADMSVKELKAVLAERNIEADGKKEDLITALEMADEENK